MIMNSSTLLNRSARRLNVWSFCGLVTILSLVLPLASVADEVGFCAFELKRPALVMPKQLSELKEFNLATQNIARNLEHLDLLHPSTVFNKAHTVDVAVEYTISQHWELFLQLPGGRDLLMILSDPFFLTVPREFLQRELQDWALEFMGGTELIFNSGLEILAMSHAAGVIPGDIYFGWISEGALPIIDIHDLMGHMAIYTDSVLREQIKSLAGLLAKSTGEESKRLNLKVWHAMGEKVPFFYTKEDGTPTMTAIGGPVITFRPNITNVTRKHYQSQDPEPGGSEWDEFELGYVSYIQDFGAIKKVIEMAKTNYPDDPRLEAFLEKYERLVTETGVFSSLDDFHTTLNKSVKRAARLRVAEIRNSSSDFQDFWVRLRSQIDQTNPQTPVEKYLSLLSPDWHRPLMQINMEFELLYYQLRDR